MPYMFNLNYLLLLLWCILLQHSGPVGSNPFSNPEDSKPHDPSDVEMKDKDPEDEALASRYHMKDEQRIIKERFEEKQRGEARRSAIEEKKAAKKVVA